MSICHLRPLLLLFFALLPAALVCAGEDEILVGAIRWDAWFKGGSPSEKLLAPEQWMYRLPFYARIVSATVVTVRSDSQQVMDHEIKYAAKAGLDYWAFCYYHPAAFPGADDYNYGWRLFLSNYRKDGMKFCLIGHGRHLGPPGEWPATAGTLVRLMQDDNYLKVLDGRPVMFFMSIRDMVEKFGSWEGVGRAMDVLREMARKGGVGDPYLVLQDRSATDAAEYAGKLGFPAISGYSAHGEGEPGERPYRDLVLANRNFWKAELATGKQVIPLVNTGWDPRPRLANPALVKTYQGPWYLPPREEELEEHVRTAVRWVGENRANAASGMVLIYGWNLFDEGGWLVPTRGEKGSRLLAVARALGRRRSRLE